MHAGNRSTPAPPTLSTRRMNQRQIEISSVLTQQPNQTPPLCALPSPPLSHTPPPNALLSYSPNPEQIPKRRSIKKHEHEWFQVEWQHLLCVAPQPLQNIHQDKGSRGQLQRRCQQAPRRLVRGLHQKKLLL